MTPAGEILRNEVQTSGPIPFSRFMEVALYHPLHGYYTQQADPDPFGKHGDFFTASQLQPVFGRLMARVVDDLRREIDCPADFQVLEAGPGRGDMEPFFRPFGYRSVDAARGEWPSALTGVIFANEFLDALPVDVEGRSVTFEGGRFAWTGEPGNALAEIPVGMLREVPRLARLLKRGFLLAIDYGYTEREAVRFPAGTLMSYRRHTAIDDVLRDPGEQDITAHVPFDRLFACAAEHGLRLHRFETLASLLLRTGERDEFREALAARDEAEATRLRMQLKTLLFGMGETFRCALLACP